MSSLKVFNYWICFFVLLVGILIIPYGIHIFMGVSSFVALLHLACWFMSFTRRFVMNPYLDSRDKAVLITGCDTGIGHELALLLHRQGLQVFAGCLRSDSDGAESLKSRNSPTLLVVPMDVTSDKSVDESVKFVKENLGNRVLWAVVNNAGLSHGGEVDWTRMEDFQSVFNVNAIGTLRVTKAFLSFLRKSKGRVINNISRTAILTFPGFVGYCMSKSAVAAFSKGLRVEMAKWQVRVISVEPFFYRTSMTNEEETLNLIQRTWDKADPETREAYGDQYLEDFKNSCRNTLSMNVRKLDELMYTFVDAILSSDPLNTYFPCGSRYKTGLKMLAALPLAFTESYEISLMPPYSATANSKRIHQEYRNGCEKNS